MENKKVLLIAGGGTLGRYTAKELTAHGASVDIICLEDCTLDDPSIHFYKAEATLELLGEFLQNRYYDGIVNFIHYADPEEYKPVHRMLTGKTDQLVFLSSYRVYDGSREPLTEDSPQLFDTVTDNELLTKEDYAIPKSKCERFIRDESGASNWTVVRPVISFSDRRYDIVRAHSGDEIKQHIADGSPILLPIETRHLHAGLDWAGNSGKLIANLLFKKAALGEAFTVSSAQEITWGEVADIYTEACGVTFKWVGFDEYLSENPWMPLWFFKYDRFFDRRIDNSKILSVTGLKNEDFTSIRDGVRLELKKIL